MPIVMQNNQVACLPFSEEQQKKSAPGQLAVIERKNALVELPVLVGTSPGDGLFVTEFDSVFVRSDRTNTAWAKERFTSDKFVRNGAKVMFILVPATEVVAVNRGAFEVPVVPKVN